ncbi:hypothetical protein TSUD_137400 [Trifolium subterraneum]|uniref:Uncharacterized protein n=1 Tax=Trifolium subterraneum TaxID=3900 RepID=A0A2Z6PLA1_TRISU|nr:hypothetical protein TSUD_137400 [Trifolium subterraneum]
MAQTTQTDGGAIGDTQEVDGSERIQIWKDVSGEAAHIREHENQIIAAARAEAAALRADVAKAEGRTQNLETKIEEFSRRMLAWETGSCSGHSRNSHPHYDDKLDDQSVEDGEDI